MKKTKKRSTTTILITLCRNGREAVKTQIMTDANFLKIKQVILNPEYQGREKLILCILLVVATDDDIAECDRDWLCKVTSYSQRRLDSRLQYMALAGYIEPLECAETQYRCRLKLS